ncbi:DUF4181 domain-containing protein [Bacillus sp. ISL-37]|uniref:DUF4181 domain-containing protein n=1 Tax=Bacillus sp. ISL-37 TaxID=2819123 RepID=UPI001BE92D8C|nr:DUF4181 domain-containing protein [Bacillus sp. ISL-37]MBT2682371.1 DUF4181 domain-containing protein [Bacillus sp. ISL-37]
MLWKFLLLAAWMISVIAFVKFLIRKTLKISKVKKASFSYNHINAKHRKIDWTVRITALLINVFLIYQVMFEGFPINLFLILLALLFTSENFVRAFFAWKFSEDPKQSILSLAEGIIFITFVVVIIQFDVLNLLIK